MTTRDRMADTSKNIHSLIIDLIRIYEWHTAPSFRDPELTTEVRNAIHQRALDWVTQDQSQFQEVNMVILNGNPISGFQVFGPYHSAKHVEYECKERFPTASVWIAAMKPPTTTPEEARIANER